MNYRVLTGYEPQILKITVHTEQPESIRLRVYDSEREHTVFTNRTKTVYGEASLYVRMPLSPRVAVVQVYNDVKGDRPKAEETTFSLLRIEKMPLERKMDAVDMSNADLRSFVPFGQRFCYNAGWMEPGLYQSSDKRFHISLQPKLYSKTTGKEANTPARIGENSGLIEISQEAFRPMTVPMRFAILCHEFSHVYMNEDKRNETEADLNGLLIYLGLGFPRIEAYQAFLETFKGAPTEQNSKRAKTIDAFITQFENHQFLTYE